MNRPLRPSSSSSSATVAAPALRLTPLAAAMRTALLAFACTTVPVFAQPATGTVPTVGTVMGGAAVATINAVESLGMGNNNLPITQSAEFAHITWETFSVATGSSVTFTQAPSNFVLNEVTGVGGVPALSQIFGSMTGAGTVALINRAGVLIGAGGVVNVGSLIASSLNFGSVGDSTATGPGALTLNNTGIDAAGRVTNDGTIGPGTGNLVQSVTLIGRGVTNSGNITTLADGSVRMIGTDGVTLTVPNAVDNPGAVRAPAGLGTLTAVPMLAAAPAAVSNTGTVQSNSGTIRLEAAAVPGLLSLVNNSGLLIATGVAGALNGGDVQLIGTGGPVSSNNAGADTIQVARAVGGTTDGSITMSSDGALTANGLTAGAAGAVTLTAVGAINGGTGTDVTSGALTATGAGIDLDTTVASLTAAGGAGPVAIRETSGVTINTLSGSDVTLTAGGPINGAAGTNVTTAGTFNVTGAGIDLDTAVGMLTADGNSGSVDIANTGALVVNTISDASNVTLSAGGPISGAAGTNVTTAGTFNVTGTGIDLDTAVGTLTSDGNSGAVDISNTGALVVNTISDSSSVTLSATGQISDGNMGATNVSTTGLFNVTGAGIDLDTAVGSLTANGGGGAVNISQTGNLAVNTVTGSSVTLASTGSITDNNGGLNNITAIAALTADAATGIDLDTSVNSLDAEVTGTGNLLIREASGISLTDLRTNNGSITVSAAGLLAASNVVSANGADANDILLSTTVGNLTAGTITANGAADVTLIANSVAGQEIRDDDNMGNSAATRVTGDVLTLTAMAGIGSGFNSQNGALDTDAGSLVATTAGGPINVDDVGTIPLITLSQNGNITLRTAGPLSLPALNVGATNNLSLSTTASTSDLTLNGLLTANTVALGAGRAIIDNVAVGDNVSATTLIADAVTGIDLDISVDTLDAAVSGTGNLVIQEANGITLTDLDTANGDITVIATAGNITAGSITALGGGDVTLTANSPGAQILDDASNATRIGGDVVTLTASGAIGSLANRVDTVAASLDASAASISIDEADGVTLTAVDTTGGAIDIAAGGTINATSVAATGGDVVLNASSGGGINAALISGTNITLGAAGAIAGMGAGTHVSAAAGNLMATGAGIDLNTNIATLTANGGGGAIGIRDVSGLTLTSVSNTAGGIVVSAAGDLLATSVTASGGNAALSSTAGTLSVTSVTGNNVVLGATGAITGSGLGTHVSAATGTLTATGAGVDLNTNVATLNANGGAGAIGIRDVSGLTLANATSSGGNIVISAASGDLVAGAISAGTGNVTLSANMLASQRILDDEPGTTSATRIVGNLVTLRAGNGIGTDAADVDIAATSLDASTGTGTLNINELDSVTLNTFSNNNAGNIALSVGTDLNTGTINAGANTLTLAARGGNLVVGDLTASSVTLNAGGSITQNADPTADVTSGTLTATAGSGIDLDTNITTLTASGGTGAIGIRETDGITLSNVSNSAGGIAVTAAGDTTAMIVSAGSGNVSLNTSSGTLGIGSVSGSNVTLGAPGAITGTNGGTHISASSGNLMVSGAGITLNTDVATLTANGGGAAISINEASGITLDSVSSSAGGVTVNAGGNVIATAVSAGGGTASVSSSGGTLSVTSVSGNNVVLGASGAISGSGGGTHVSASTGNLMASGAGITLNTDVATLNANGGAGAGAGAISINEASGITLNSVTSTAGGVTVNAGGSVIATAVSAGTGTASISTTSGALGVGSVTGNNVTLGSTGAITGIGTGTHVTAPTGTLMATGTGITLNTRVANLIANGGAGAISIAETDAVVLNNLNNTAGGIVLGAGGTITADNVAAGGGNLSLTASGGASGIVAGAISAANVALTAGGAITDGNGAGTGNVAATSLTANAASGITLDTSVTSLSADGGTGAVTLRETDDVMIGAISGSAVTLTAGGALIDGNTTGVNVTTAGLLTATAGSGIDLDTSVGSLDGSVTGAGNLSIREASGITLTAVDTANGNINVTANAGNIVAGTVAVSGIGGVSLTASGAGGQILDDGGDGAPTTTRISGNLVTLTANSGIGTAAEDVDINVSTLVASTTSGPVNIDELNSVTVNTLQTGSGNISLSAGGPLVLPANASATNLSFTTRDAGAALTVNGLTAIGVTLTSGGAILDGNGAGNNVNATSLSANAASGINLDTSVSTLTGNGGAAAITIRETDAITLNTLGNAGGGITVSTANGTLIANGVNAGSATVVLGAGGSGGNLIANGVTGGSVMLVAGGTLSGGAGTDVSSAGLLTATAGSGIDLDTDIASLDASVTGAGSLVVREANGLTLARASTANGDIAVTANAGNLVVGTVAASGGGDVVLTATSAGAQILDDGNDNAPGTTRISGDVVTLAANAGIGSAAEDVDTAANSLAANTASGPININELDAVIATMLSTASGNINASTVSGTLAAMSVNAAGPGSTAALSAGGELAVGSVSASTVALSAGAAISDSNGAGTNNITSAALSANAGSGIALDTRTGTLNASVSGSGGINISEADGLAIGTVSASDGPVALTVGGPLLIGNISGDGVNLTATTSALNFGIDDRIDGGDGAVVLRTPGAITQVRGRDGASISGGSISLFAGGSIGELVVPLEVDAGGGAVLVTLSDAASQGFISGKFGSLNESSRVLGLSSNSVLSGVVGAIQSSFARRVNFSLDSSQFASSARIFATEGTGVLLPEDQRE